MTGTPQPRRPVADPQLWRPDWLADSARDPGLLWLDKNENRDPELHEVIGEVAAEISPQALCTYPDCAPLYQQIAEYACVDPNQLLLTPGSDGAIRIVFEAYISEGDKVLHTAPTFAMYDVYSKMYGVEQVKLEYQPSPQGPLLKSDHLLAQIREHEPKLVCLPNPDSPTGTVFTPAEMEQIIEQAHSVGSLILIDEAYHPFYEKTVAPLTSHYPGLIVARTFSKAWGLAGLRIGYSISSAEVTQILHKVRPMYEVNTFAVVFMQEMMKRVDVVLDSVKRLNDGRDGFIEAMKELNLDTFPSFGNFVHVAFGEAAESLHAKLEQIALYRRSTGHPSLERYSRFSATTLGQFQPLISCIQDELGNGGGR